MAHTENTYSFTTTEDDAYLDRVEKEAQPDVNFILTTERSTIHGAGRITHLLFRKKITALALLDSSLTLGRAPLGDLFRELATEVYLPNEWEELSNEWAELSIEADEETLAEELVNLRNELGRLNNLLHGRVVRVTVESF
jgi:hypothetical protein